MKLFYQRRRWRVLTQIKPICHESGNVVQESAASFAALLA
jgi:hypothetical protein